MRKNSLFIGIDVGGGWLKGVGLRFNPEQGLDKIPGLLLESPVTRVSSRLSELTTIDDFIAALDEMFSKILVNNELVSGIGISTAGIVDYHGKSVTLAANHLKILKNPGWVDWLKKSYKAPVILINDAEAAAIGASALGYLKGSRIIGLMPIGTGVGFFLWRNGRRWAPNRMLPLLGSIMTPSGSFDQIAGTAILSEQIGHDMSLLFSDSHYTCIKEQYEEALANVIYSACVIYNTDLILIGGGLAEAVRKINYPLDSILQKKIYKKLLNFDKKTEIKLLPEGNTLQLIGTCLLAVGEHMVEAGSLTVLYNQISTETAYDKSLELHKMDAADLVKLMWRTEEKAGKSLEVSLSDISESAQIIAKALFLGGRLIYVGAGTSGRLAAIDAVEIACTFGFPRERVYSLIAGGLTDAVIDIETNFEEDASAVPEMLLTGINSKDVVIGISVSGSAYYVKSALALAKAYGAFSIFIEDFSHNNAPFCDKIISLNSGNEIIAGSTRMKAGTATKKVLNFLSTTAMILLGRVYGCYMIEVECINQKLIGRAVNILIQLFKIEKDDAYAILKRNELNLHKAIEEIDQYFNCNLSRLQGNNL